MGNFTSRLFLAAIFTFLTIVAHAATVDDVIVSQVDTIALKGKKGQVVLKINIRISGLDPLNMTRFVINTSNQNNEDVDSVAVYYTSSHNRFSLADYSGDLPQLMAKRKAISTDSVEFTGLSFTLNPGDNYFWITMDLSNASRAGRYLDAKILAGAITIDGLKYPATLQDPTGNCLIYDVYFRENFEKKDLYGEPFNWTQTELNGSVRWISNLGGGKVVGGTINSPPKAKSGNLNALFFRLSTTPYRTRLVSPPLDLSLASTPMLTFYHAQLSKLGYNDSSKVLYKVGSTGTWKEIRSYRLYTGGWEKRSLVLPTEMLAPNVYLGFEGIINSGWGVCVDSITIFETGMENRSIKEIVGSNYLLDGVPQGSSQNPVLRVNIRVKGNNTPIHLNSINVTSSNTSDLDIEASGVKLFYTNDSVFLWPKQIGTAQSFSSGTVSFSGLNKELETGDNYLWVTYDVKISAEPSHVIDAKINAGDIVISNGYSNVSIDPAGSRIIKRTIYFEDFEDPLAWDCFGEFEIAEPQGKGGLSYGKPDPSSAYSGSKVLGTDLTGLGANSYDYEPYINSTSNYSAYSKVIDATYYKDVTLQFYRYLNLDFSDTVALQYKLEGSSDWQNIWVSKTGFIESSWQKQTFDKLKFLNRKRFNLRFKLLYTDFLANYSGLNVDYLFLTGNYIPFDASVETVLGPVSSCSLTNIEKAKVRVRNTGPQPLANFPIKLSLDGGKTYITENVAGPIPVNGYFDYEFTNPIDLSEPKSYSIIVKTAHPDDNYPDNDSIVFNVISYPTYNLPYQTSFEEDTTFWLSGGLNSSWREYSFENSGLFNAPPDGEKCWKTSYSGYYKFYENSYVQSPCISFSGADLPMVDVKYNYATEAKMDGAIFQYSTDEGVTWKYVGEDNYDYAWNWYNDTVKTLKHNGWTGDTPDNKWLQGRQILPSDLVGNSKVQFRFVFKVDSTTSFQREGFAFDDIKFYEAPHDIGVDTIKGISNPACQYQNSPYLNVDIKNYGVRNMKTNDIIVVGAMVNGVVQAIDTFKLASDLAKGASRNFTFTKPVNFVDTGKYTIKAYTMNGAEDSFYNTNNDTASISFTVNPNPLTGLPDSLFTAEPDTVILKLITNADYKYKWHDNSTASTFDCTTPGYYKATVINNITGCLTKDSTFIKGLISDVKLDAILTPTNHCGYDDGDAVKAIIRIKNTGTDTLRINRAIPVNYILDGGTVVLDTVKLLRRLKPDSTVVLQLREVMDLSDNRLYSLKMYTSLPTDTVKTNDSDSIGFTIYGYPTLDLGAATIVHKDTMYKFTAPAGYSTYKWSNDSVTNTNTVKSSGWYKLTVQDNNGCPAKDSAYLFLKVRDLIPHRLVSPLTTCKNDTLSDVIFRIKNNGTDTIRTSDTIFISYQFNDGAIVADTLKPVSEIVPGDSIDFKFDGQENLKTIGAYKFKMEVRSAPEPDYIKKNDTITYYVKVHGLPQPDIGPNASIQALNYTIDPDPDPNDPDFVSFLWQDGSTDPTYVITQYHQSVDERYQVTVTDMNGCQNSTPKIIKRLEVPDVSISEIVLPSTACSLSNTEAITVKVKNTGSVLIISDKIIRLKYQVNGGAFSRIDTLKFASNFIQNQVLTHTFKQLADLSAVGTKAVKVFVEYSTDVRNDNDTLTSIVQVFNRPNVSLSPNDTIIADLPYTIDAGAGFASYAWNTGATSQTIEASVAGTYIVTVTNESFCSASAIAHVLEKTFDLGVTSVDLPDNACLLTNGEKVTVNVMNTGTETLTNMPITLSYVLNGGTQISENFLFTGKYGSSQKFSFAEKIDLSEVNTHTLVLSLTYANDEVSGNNELTKYLLITGAPSVVFSNEVRDTIRTNVFPYVLDAGPFTSFKWQDDTDNRVFSAPGEGWYKVTVVNSATCIGKDSVYILNSTAIRNIDDKVKISIFPNPSKDNVYIDMFLDAPETINYEVISGSGSVIINKKLSGSLQYNEIIDGLKLAKGVYYIRVYGKDWLITEKIIIQ